MQIKGKYFLKFHIVADSLSQALTGPVIGKGIIEAKELERNT